MYGNRHRFCLFIVLSFQNKKLLSQIFGTRVKSCGTTQVSKFSLLTFTIHIQCMRLCQHSALCVSTTRTYLKFFQTALKSPFGKLCLSQSHRLRLSLKQLGLLTYSSSTVYGVIIHILFCFVKWFLKFLTENIRNSLTSKTISVRIRCLTHFFVLIIFCHKFLECIVNCFFVGSDKL